MKILILCTAIIAVLAEPPVSNGYLPPNQGSGSGAPSSNYGAPSSGSFGGQRQTDAVFGRGPPSSSYGTPSFNSQSSRPSNQYIPPNSQFGAQIPSSQYGAPSRNQGAPSSQYGAPSQNQGVPSSQYGAPSQNQGAPSSQYGAPNQNQGYQAPNQNQQAPSSQYGAPGFGQQQARPSQQYGAPGFGGQGGNNQYSQNGGYNNGGPNNGGPNRGYLPPGSGQGGYDDGSNGEPANYNFEYMVKDDQSGNDFGHRESRQGDRAEGLYYVLLPDGRKQTVQYEADQGGYRPRISYEDTGRGLGGLGGLGGYDRNGQNQGYDQGGPY